MMCSLVWHIRPGLRAKRQRKRLSATPGRSEVPRADAVWRSAGDFVQVIANTPSARAELVSCYTNWFGERWFMLPNPSYGSWEPALFNNAWGLPAGERRNLKHEALDFSK